MTSEPPASLRKRFVITEGTDGSVVVEQSARDRKRDVFAGLAAEIPMWGLFVYIAYFLFWDYGWKPSSVSDPILWVLVGIAAVGIVQFPQLALRALGREQWLASDNELLWRRQLFGHTWEKQFRDGKLLLRRRPTSSGINMWYMLYFRPHGGWRRRIYLTLSRAVVEDLATVLNERLNWPVERPW